MPRKLKSFELYLQQYAQSSDIHALSTQRFEIALGRVETIHVPKEHYIWPIVKYRKNVGLKASIVNAELNCSGVTYNKVYKKLGCNFWEQYDGFVVDGHIKYGYIKALKNGLSNIIKGVRNYMQLQEPHNETNTQFTLHFDANVLEGRPCPSMFQFIPSSQHGNYMLVTMRSSDLLIGLPHDIIEYVYIGRKVFGWGQEFTLKIFLGSSHIYLRDYFRMIKEKKIVPNLSLQNFQYEYKEFEIYGLIKDIEQEVYKYYNSEEEFYF